MWKLSENKELSASVFLQIYFQGSLLVETINSTNFLGIGFFIVFFLLDDCFAVLLGYMEDFLINKALFFGGVLTHAQCIVHFFVLR